MKTSSLPLLPVAFSESKLSGKWRRILTWLVLLSGMGADLSGPIQAQVPLRTVAWNIEWFQGGRITSDPVAKAAQMKGCQAAVKMMNPDILLASEIADWAAFQELVSVVPNLAVHCVSAFPSRDSPKLWPQQLAIASKLKCRGTWWEAFAPSPDLPDLRRGFGFAALEHPQGGLIMVYSLHLKSNGGSDTKEGEINIAKTRAESVKQLMAHRAKVTQMFEGQEIVGWVMGGDINTNQDGQFPLCTVVQQMTAAGFHNAWSTTPKAQRLTWRSDPDPAQRRFEPTTFDYFFTTGFKPTQAKIIEVPRELSDHYPIGLLLEKP